MNHPPQPPLGATPEPSAADRQIAERILGRTIHWHASESLKGSTAQLISAHVAEATATARAALAQCEKLAKAEAGVLETIICEIKAHDMEHPTHGVGCSCHDDHARKIRSLFKQSGLYDIKEGGFHGSTKSLSNLMTVIAYLQRNP